MPSVTPVLGLSPFLWIMLIFLVVLVVLLLLGDFGGHFDVNFDGHVASGVHPLSIPVVAAFGTTFGGVAALVDTLELPLAAVVISGALSAGLMAGGMYFLLVRFFVRAQISSDVVIESLVGRQAEVTVPVGPGATGQVLVITAERGRTLIPAVSAEEIRTDAAVVIEGVVGNSVRVRKVT